MNRTPLYRSLYVQVLVAIAIGIAIGHFYPQAGVALKPLGDGFVKLIKMAIAPIIFCTVVSGIAGMQNMKSVGKTGGYALLYFEIVSTLALVIGLVVVNLVQPGAGMHIDPASLDTKGIDAFAVSSSEGLRYLVDALDDAARGRLLDTPVYVPHARIAENAAALGLRRVVLTGAADAGIIKGLCTYNWR